MTTKEEREALLKAKHDVLEAIYEEDSEADLDMNVVMTESGKIVEIQGTAEKETFSRNDLNGLLDMSQNAVTTLIGLMKNGDH